MMTPSIVAQNRVPDKFIRDPWNYEPFLQDAAASHVQRLCSRYFPPNLDPGEPVEKNPSSALDIKQTFVRIHTYV